MIDSLGFIKYNHFVNPNDYVYPVYHAEFKVDIIYTTPVQACVHHIWNTYHNAKHVYIGYEFSHNGLLSCQFKNVIDGYESSIGWFPTLDREKDKEYTLPLDVVAEQIVKNTKAGHAESVDFVVDVANELKKQTGVKPIVKKTERQCKKIKDECISTCSEISLPTQDNGFSFFQCVNQCLEKEGCL